MIFEQIPTGGCQSYLVGCEATRAAVLIDPEFSQIDRYVGLAGQLGLHIRYIVDTHTHADHFSASHELQKLLKAPVVMNRLSPAPYADLRLDDGDMLIVGELRIQALHTSDHTRRSDKISTLAAATLREPGFTRAVARAVALKVWRDAGYELES